MVYKILQPIPERYEERQGLEGPFQTMAVSYTHLRAHET